MYHVPGVGEVLTPSCLPTHEAASGVSLGKEVHAPVSCLPHHIKMGSIKMSYAGGTLPLHAVLHMVLHSIRNSYQDVGSQNAVLMQYKSPSPQ